ncbi:L-threonine ammonia-lyase [Pseudorhodobacter antarcticus]|jgi:threonine dehydratase|uniref:L-threonine ammonia-lyase n=2 Tax=Pseudorhodobacter antarcticus TaxID=1077947 RepID=A0A1H8CM33_9RHOB|nr:L-threonine ammonia-lyase [Pseudorhodobacter antarcticus]
MVRKCPRKVAPMPDMPAPHTQAPNIQTLDIQAPDIQAPDIQAIEAAARRLDGHARRTPLLTSPFLDEIAGRRVFVKAECLQHTGSFKYRGAWSAVSALEPGLRAQGVIAYSSGNHAQGVALAARQHRVPAVIIMPNDAPKMKIDNTRALGAEVVLYDRAAQDRDAIGLALSTQRGLTLIKPYDDAMVIAGQASTGLEIAEQAAAEGITAADVLVCCGGGGLTSGIAIALASRATGLRARPVEPAEFDDVTRSLATGTRQHNAHAAGSLCDAIVTPTPGALTLPVMARLCGPGIVVTDDEALRAVALAWSRLKVVLEPGGAVALAAALFHGDEIATPDVICVASGGNVDPDVFARALAMLDG